MLNISVATNNVNNGNKGECKTCPKKPRPCYTADIVFGSISNF